MRLLRPVRWLVRLTTYFLLACTVLALLSVLTSPRCEEVTEAYDTAVVLGGGTRAERLSTDTLSRVSAGVVLYQRGLVQRLHMTGGGDVADHSIGEEMAKEAARAGVPNAAISWEGTSRSTLENALFSAPMLPPPGAGSLIVVTEPFHALRGAASFLWAGYPSAFCGSPDQTRSDGGLFKAVVREVAAWAFNILRGAVWSLASVFGVAGALPKTFLH